MKNLVKSILVVAVMLGTYSGYANETLNSLTLTSTLKKGNYITVSDSSGQVIYNGRINYNGNLTSLFDFTQLKDGIYNIEINKDFVIEIKSIQVKNNIVRLLKPSEEKIFKPVFRTEDSKILISKFAFTSHKMTVELYYENELIYSETLEGENILSRIYQLDNTLRGDYTAIIKSNDRVFIENFRI